MKYILDIATTPYLTPKGSSLRVDSVLKKLSKENRVDLLVYPVGDDTNYHNVRIIRASSQKSTNVGVSEVSLKKIKLDLKIFKKAFSLLQSNNYDIVHCEDFEAGFIGAILSLFFHKPKYVYDLHNTIVDNLKITGKPKLFLMIAKLISSWVYTRYDMIIANWKIYKGIGKKKVFLLYDESDIKIKKTDIPTEKKYLAYSGNFKQYQGVENFIKVYSKVMPSYDLVLIGNPTEDIKGLVSSLGLEKRIFFTGVLDIEKSNYILQHAEYCLIPRISGEQPGLKMIHHIMLDKVSLASDISANTEVLKNGYNAVLYKDNKELGNILREIDEGNLNNTKFTEGIQNTQKEINRIWSYEYFKENYSKVFENEK